MSSSIEPKGESLRKALRWIGSERLADSASDIRKLVNEAGLRFDLTPPEQEFLWHALVQEGKDPHSL